MMQPYLRVTGIRQAGDLPKRFFLHAASGACLFVQNFWLKAIQMKIPRPR